VSDWFKALSQPLRAGERLQVSAYLHGLGLERDLPVESVPDWKRAHAAIVDPRWDQRWWDAEQQEQARLTRKTTADIGERDLWRTLSASLLPADVAYEAAADAARRSDCSDAALIRAAAGSLSQAVYLGELARLAAETVEHPFRMKKALFASGHWPLGIVGGTYYVF